MANMSYKKGFTLIELCVVVFIFVLIMGMNITLRGYSLMDAALQTKTTEIVENMRLALIRSVSRYQDSKWGVYFNNAAQAQSVVFKGSNYATRDSAYDLVTNLPSTLTYGTININGGGTEVVFDKVTGKTAQNGSIVLNGAQGSTKTITINPLGSISVQ